jgi:hypothetical protein
MKLTATPAMPPPPSRDLVALDGSLFSVEGAHLVEEAASARRR